MVINIIASAEEGAGFLHPGTKANRLEDAGSIMRRVVKIQECKSGRNIGCVALKCKEVEDRLWTRKDLKKIEE